jgi:hypothetical protein
VELYNDAGYDVPVGGWRLLTSGRNPLFFAFPSTAVIPANTYVVIAKDPTKFRQVYPSVPTNVIYGPYTGELGNGGDRVLLVDDNGEEADYVKYDDKFPWPIGTLSLFLLMELFIRICVRIFLILNTFVNILFCIFFY